MVRKRVKIIFFVLVTVVMAVEVTKAKFYADVTECFTPTAEMGEPKYITLHHDGISRPTTLNEIDRYHRDSCKWESGFAYHYYISENKIYKCRDEHQIGTHVKNGNGGNIGICIHGDFNETRPTLNFDYCFDKQTLLSIQNQKRKHQTASRLGAKQNIVLRKQFRF